MAGIGDFGNLTINIGGKTIKVADFDKDNNGKLDEQEWQTLLNDNNINPDSFNGISLDRNGDKNIDIDEIAIWNQEEQMNETLKSYNAQIATRFPGNVNAQMEVRTALKDFMSTFVADYIASGSNIDNMATKFEKALAAKFEEICTSIEENNRAGDNETEMMQIIDDVVDEFITNRLLNKEETLAKNGIYVDQSLINRFGDALYNEALSFKESYNGISFQTDLVNHLTEFLAYNPLSELNDDFSEWSQFKSEHIDGKPYISPSEIPMLQESALSVISSAINAGIVFKDESGNVLTVDRLSAKIDVLIASDPQKLVTFVDEIITTINESSMSRDYLLLHGLSENVITIGNDYSVTGYKPIMQQADNTNNEPNSIDSNKPITQSIESLKTYLQSHFKEVLNEQRIEYNEDLFNECFGVAFDQVLEAHADDIIVSNGQGPLGFLYPEGTQLIKCSSDEFTQEVADIFIPMYRDGLSTDIPATDDEEGEGSSTVEMTTAGVDYSEISDREYIRTKSQLKRKITNVIKRQLKASAKAACEANDIKWGVLGWSDNGHKAFDRCYEDALKTGTAYVLTPANVNVLSIAQKVANRCTGAFNSWLNTRHNKN